MNNSEIKTEGLKVKALDPRTFKLGAIFDFPLAKDLPKEFSFPPTKIKNQLAVNPKNDKCSSYSSISASELQEEVELNPDYTFAVGKGLSKDDPNTFGLSLEEIMSAHVKVGAIEQKDVPPEINVEDPKYRTIKNWPEDLIKKAYLHKKDSYFQVHKINGQDYFDSIKSAIWKFKDKKQAVVFGTMWDWSIYQVYMDMANDNGYGHAMEIVGWCERNGQEWLKVQQSAGERAGENGYHYFSRTTINHAVEQFGALMHVDMPRNTAEWYLNNNIKESDNWVVIMYKVLLIKNLIDKLKELIGLQAKKETMPTQTMLQKFCLAIQEHEGWYKGSRSFRNNNPGNLRYVGQASATGKDKGGFCIFPNYEVGFKALSDMVKRAATGLSSVYKPNMTFAQFFHTYAPSSDDNDPDFYAKFVANKCGVAITTQIKELVA